MIYLHKILPLFVLPIGITLFLVLAGLRFRRPGLIWGGLAVLWFSSTPAVGRLAVRAAEGWQVRGLPSDAPTADAIVVLSEGRVLAPGNAAVSEWSDADRFFGGVELFKEGKSSLLVFTGAALPWESRTAPEGEILARYARMMGVPDTQIVQTSRVENTAEEAKVVATILRRRFQDPTHKGVRPTVLLVTSAFHMQRAQTLFERAGMTVMPFPVDFKVPARARLSVLEFLPSGGGLAQTEVALREAYGRIFYLVVK